MRARVDVWLALCITVLVVCSCAAFECSVYIDSPQVCARCLRSSPPLTLPPPQHLSLLNHHAVRFSLRVAYSTSTPDSGCRIEATLNHKLMFDEPCREALSLVVSMMDSDGWHELEVAVVEPLYASVCDNSVLKLAM